MLTYSGGITVQYPSEGETGWAATFLEEFIKKVSDHDHTGSGDGVQLSTDAFGANAITDAKIRLTNNSSLRARNAANSADVNILKVDTNNALVIQGALANDTYLTFKNNAGTGTVNWAKCTAADKIQLANVDILLGGNITMGSVSADFARIYAKNITAGGTALGLEAPAGNGINFNVNNGDNALNIDSDSILDFVASMSNSALDPTSDAPADWVEIKIGGTTRFLPAYAAS